MIGPSTSLAAILSGANICILYADTASGGGSGDGDFNVYCLSGESDGGFTWSNRILVNDDGANGQRDQFMARATWSDLSSHKRFHAVWYDTRDDPQQASAQHVELSVYSAYSDDLGETWSDNVDLEIGALDTELLDNPLFIGDHIDITAVGTDGDVLVVYTATNNTFGAGPLSPDPEDQPNEIIKAVWIDPD